MSESFLRYYEKHNKAKERQMETTLGTLPDDDAKRDAIHIAVAPVMAAEKLQPGQRVGLYPNGTAGLTTPTVGIVDPFLTTSVKFGQRFYLVLLPRTITGLRHAWTHPAFPDEAMGNPTLQKGAANTQEAEQWFERHSPSGITGPEFIERLKEYVANDEDHINVGYDSGYEPNYDEMWFHFETLTGISVAFQRRKPWFSCAC